MFTSAESNRLMSFPVETVLALWQQVPASIQLLVWGVVLFTLIALIGQVAVVFMVLMERKVLAWMTQRKGPNRVGPWGLLQTVADGVKLLFKEDIMTPDQDKWLFTLAPVIFFLPAFVLYAFIPLTRDWVALQLPLAALAIFAISSISVIGIVLAGLASNNKYSLLGGMRSAAQAISYEIPLVMSVLAVVVFAGSANLHVIVEKQNQGLGLLNWFWLSITPISFLIFLISSIAEVNRIPFDLPEAESELVSGYNTEYSGMKFAMFFLAEYAALFAMSALTVIFFFGGYYSPIGGLLVEKLGIVESLNQSLSGLGQLVAQLEMVIWLLSKTYLFIFLAMWLRATLPRLKPDQLMGFSWKFLIPLSLINIFLVAIEKLWLTHNMSLLYFVLWAGTLLLGVGGFSVLMSRIFTGKLSARLVKIS
ncbi:MAG: NADH-quinone oxidoreductase subunit NuoH [Candidatus Melainabacteria bacterium]|nr:NADH-quinone oxidoreductase subunit NuoH [Candidatus Melainabacteria bacterium]